MRSDAASSSAFPPSALSLEQLPARIASAQGLWDEDGPRAVVDLLLLPVRFAGPGALSVLFNGFGPTIARNVIGPPRTVHGRHIRHAVFDSAYAADDCSVGVRNDSAPHRSCIGRVARA